MRVLNCNNCGHPIEADELLQVMRFAWLDPEHTASQISCPACMTTTLQRAHTFDEEGRPIAGEFHVIRTFNRIRRVKP